MPDPQQQTAALNQAPYPKKVIPLTGKWIPANEGTDLGANFKQLKNLRYTDTHPVGIGGMTKINSAVMNGTYLKARSAFHYTKSQPAESHLLVQAWNAGLTASQILQNETAVPGTGEFEADPLWTDAAGADIGFFSIAPEETLIYCNSKENLIWGGDEAKVGGFFISNPDSQVVYDYTERVQNTMTDAQNVATMTVTGGGLDAYTKVLLHMENNANDSSGNSHNATVSNLTYSASVLRFGTYSAAFNGTNSSMYIGDHADFDLSGGVWTADCWVYFNSLSTAPYIWGQATNANNYTYCHVTTSGVVVFRVFASAATAVIMQSGIGAVQKNRWHHLEVGENGNDYYMFIDGVLVATATSANRPANYTSYFTIGAYYDSSSWSNYTSGYFDEFRLSVGAARHTAAFTPQVSAYSASVSSTLCIVSTRQLSGLKLYVQNPNASVATVASDYWTGSGLTLTPIPLDYMEYSSDALAQAAYVSSMTTAAITLDYMEYSTSALAQAAYVTSDPSLDLMEYSADALAEAAYVSNGAVSVWTDTLESNSAGWSNYHLRQVLVAADIANASMTKVRVALTASASGALYIDLLYLGRRSSATYDMLTTGQGKVKLTFSGSDSVTVSAGATVYSDWVSFATDGTEDLILSVDYGASANNSAYTPTANGSIKHWAGTNGAALDAAPAAGTAVASRQIDITALQYQSLRVYSESTTINQGLYSLKALAAITDSLNKTLTRTIASPISLSGVNTLKFAIRASRTGSNIKIGIHDSGGTTTETTPNVAAADTWQTVSWDLSGVANANKDAIDQIIITVMNADAANTFYIDGASSLLAYSDASAKTQGSYALKAIADITTSETKTLIRTIASPIDLTGVVTLKFDVRASREGINFSLAIHDSGGTWTSASPNILVANTYQTVTWDVSAVANADKNAIDQIRLTILNADAANTIYIDNFYAEGVPVALQSYSEATIITQGAYALKGIADATTSLNKTLTRTIFSPIDLTGVDTLTFDIRSTRTGSNIKIGIHDSGGTTTETTPNITVADTWQTVSWDISGVSAANKNAIDSVVITVMNADAANTFYIDSFGPTGGALYDGTAVSGKTLAQTGLISFGATTNTAKTKMYNGLVGYLYRFTFTGIDSGVTVSHATVAAPVQPIVDLWDGVDRECMAFYVYKNSTYNDYTLNVFENEYDSNDTSSFVELDGLATGTNTIVFASYERLMGINFGLIGGHVNTTGGTTMTIKYSSDGSTFTTVGTIDDGTSVGGVSFGQSGTVTWNPPAAASEFMSKISKVTPRYHYEISFSQTFSADVQIFYVSGIPVQRAFGQYKFPLMAQDMLFLCCNMAGRKNAAVHSEYQTSQIFNGDNAGEVEFGETGELTCGASLYNLYGYNLYNLIIFFKDNEMWKLSGNFPDWQRHLVSETVGCPAPMTLKAIGLPGDVPQGLSRNVIVWQGSQGVYISDGRAALPIHADIENYFDEKKAECIKASLIGASWADIDMRKMEYHLHVASGSSATVPDTELVFDLKRWRWFEIERGTGKHLICGTAVKDTDGNYYNYGFVDTGYMLRLENGTDFDGNDIVFTLELGDQVLAENDFTMETRVERLQLVTVANQVSLNDISYTHYVDTETTGTAFTMAPRATNKRVANIVKPINSKVGVFHSGKFEMTTDNETTGFEPLALAYLYSIQYEKVV